MMWRWTEREDGAENPPLVRVPLFAHDEHTAAPTIVCARNQEPTQMDTNLAQRLQKISKHQLLTLTHTGRKSGNPYKVTIWFIAEDDKVFLVSADTRRNWTRNVAVNPAVKLEIGAERFEGTVAPITFPAEREHVMRLVQEKYWYALPFLLASRFMHAIGIVQDHSGAFEVRLSG